MLRGLLFSIRYNALQPVFGKYINVQVIYHAVTTIRGNVCRWFTRRLKPLVAKDSKVY